jgi:hypothetical protein
MASLVDLGSDSEASLSEAEVYCDADGVKDRLIQLLDNIGDHAVGSFATSGTLSHAPKSGLYIDGLEVVGLPLFKRDAAELGKICHEAPFGKGSETIVDTTVRKICAPDVSLLEILSATGHVYSPAV